MEFKKSLQMDEQCSHTKYNKLWIQKWEVIEILCHGKVQQRSEVLRHLVPGEEHTISSFTWGQVKYSVWGRWLFTTNMTTLLLHEDMKNYSVAGRSYYACWFSIHIHVSHAYCSSHKMPNLNWAYLTNHKLDPHDIWIGNA